MGDQAGSQPAMSELVYVKAENRRFVKEIERLRLNEGALLNVREENERLRFALENIAHHPVSEDRGERDWAWEANGMRQIALDVQ